MRLATRYRRFSQAAAVLGVMFLSSAASAKGGSPTTVEVSSGERLAVTLETIDAEISGQLTKLDQSTGVTLADGTRLPLADVLSIRFEPRRLQPSPKYAGELTLTDGSVLPYVTCDIDQETLRLKLGGQSTANISLASVVSWRVEGLDESQPAIDPPPTTADTLFVKRRNGAALTPVEGVVLGVSAERVRFVIGTEGDSEPVEVPWSRLGGIRFYRTTPSDQPTALVRLVNDGYFATETLQLDEGWLVFSSPAGESRVAIEAIDSIDLSAGRITPVADLRLLDHRWKPSFGEADRETGYVLNSSFSGEPITLRTLDPRVAEAWPRLSVTREFATGIALKSRGELRFALPPGAQRLKGRIGLDPATVRAGSAEVSILLGERKIWSGVVDGTTRPVEINAAINAEPTLTLRVDYGDNLDSGDHVHFAELRVIQ